MRTPRRHELSDFEWPIIEPSCHRAARGAAAGDRKALNGIYWRLRTRSDTTRACALCLRRGALTASLALGATQRPRIADVKVDDLFGAAAIRRSAGRLQ
jgi:hypothetical protein